MSQKGSRINSPSKQHLHTYENSYITNDHSTINPNPQTYSSFSMPNKNISSTPNVNTYHQSRLSSNEVSQITGSRVRQGSVVKGIIRCSRIQYVPYQKKVVDYETRVRKQMIPKTRKVVDYEERKIVENVPRQVVKQDYYAVQKITQYYKQIVPERKIQMVPVQRKVKRMEYVPIQKQIVHYPQNQDYRTVRGQSRAFLQGSGVEVKPDAQYRPIQSDLLYKYTSNVYNQQNPIGYVDVGTRRYLSTAPTYNNNFGYSHVQPVHSNSSYIYSQSQLPYQKSQIFYEQYPTQKSIQNNESQRFNNVISGNKYQYRHGNSGYIHSPRGQFQYAKQHYS